MKLAPNFFLREFLWSDTAARAGRVVEAPEDIVENLRYVATKVLQPIRDALCEYYKKDMPLDPSSGYRPVWLNKMVKGSTNSDHIIGMACDFGCPYLDDYELAAFIRDKMLPVLPIKQLIYEFDSWVHIGASFPNEAPRRQVLTIRSVMEGGKSKTVKLEGLVKRGE